ncbi:uncharacterized protein ACIB01_019299 [Guaruba guarouba]
MGWPRAYPDTWGPLSCIPDAGSAPPMLPMAFAPEVSPPRAYLRLPYSGPPRAELPPACLYQDLQPPPAPPLHPSRTQGLGGPEGFAALLGPPDWGGDGARWHQASPSRSWAPPYQSRFGLGGAPLVPATPNAGPGAGGPGLFGGLLSGRSSPPRTTDPQRLSPPRINVGPSFQAAVPAAAGGGCSGDLAGPGLLQRPARGGTNQELALHCLTRASGSLTDVLELLLLGTAAPLPGYHYTGSDTWTPRERLLFAKALAQHGKDFGCIQQAVPSKRMTQCVEFYYLHKSELGQARTQMPPGAPIARFPCKLCGKIFPKIKSRNAHMKIHRQQGGGGQAASPPPV